MCLHQARTNEDLLYLFTSMLTAAKDRESSTCVFSEHVVQFLS
jgi:hypothetical protein